MITFILLWLIAIVILILDHKNPVQRWFSAALFLAGFNEIHYIILERAPSLLAKYPLLSNFEHLITFSSSVFLYPYTFLLGAIYYYSEFDETWRKRRKRLVPMILIPVLAVNGILLFQGVNLNHPGFCQLCFFWLIPSYLTANYLLIKTFFRAKSWQRNSHSFITCVLITPITIADLTINYILPGFGFTINLNFVINIVLFISFFYLATQYGILGKKLQIEQLSLDNSFKTMTNGAALLNHALKNEIAKISMCASSLLITNRKPMQVKDCVRIILSSTHQIMAMLERASQCTRDFSLIKSMFNLKTFIEGILAEHQGQFLEKKIQLITDLGSDLWLVGDQLHLYEVFNNIINNAVEAMESGGQIYLSVTTTKRFVTITIKDTGKGIPNKLLPHIFEPFYTTKNPSRNFGLGLLFCYKVLKKHGGTIEVESKLNQGTTFYLNLPRFYRKKSILARGVSNVQNKSISG